jgi:hypothetical protein
MATKHVMLDLETLGTGSNAAILSIGAVVFDPFTKEWPENPATFYRPVDLFTSMNAGGQIDASTIAWWMQQSDQARADAFAQPEGAGRGAIQEVINDFADWLGFVSFADKVAPDPMPDNFTLEGDEISIWGNGVGFDNVILANAYRRFGLPVPWNFHKDRCYRTVIGFGGETSEMLGAGPLPKRVQEGTHHNALADAISQAKHLKAIITI